MKLENKERMRKTVLVASIVLILIAFLLLGYFIGIPLVKQFRESPESFRDYVNAHGVLGPFLMIAITMLQVVVAILPGEPFELAAGFVFGWVKGSFLCMIGIAAASTMVFLLVRLFGKKVVELFFHEDKIRQYAFLQNTKRLNVLVFILFLIPGTPKDLLTYVVPLTPMPLADFLWISLLARVPSLLSSTITGGLAQKGSYTAAIITYAITAVISGLMILWYRKSEKKQKSEDQAA